MHNRIKRLAFITTQIMLVSSPSFLLQGCLVAHYAAIRNDTSAEVTIIHPTGNRQTIAAGDVSKVLWLQDCLTVESADRIRSFQLEYPDSSFFDCGVFSCTIRGVSVTPGGSLALSVDGGEKQLLQECNMLSTD